MPHVDDLNDAVLVGLAVEDDARALLAALEADGGVYVQEEGRTWPVVLVDGEVNLIELARVLRRRYLAASTPPPETA